MKLTFYKYIVVASILIISLASCITDEVSSSPAHQPTFSTDSLNLGRVFTNEGTPTRSFMVYNRYDKVMNISSISFADGGKGIFRINVDGLSGSRFSNIEIRPNDSIYVFVEATLPQNGSEGLFNVSDRLDFVTNGVTRSVIISATGEDCKRLTNITITADTTWRNDIAYRIFDTLTVAQGATLTLEPGTRLYFHDGASLRVDGTLISQGTAADPVTLRGDRTGFVAADIPYEIMSKQWDGVTFTGSSHSNSLAYTVIENTWHGVYVDSCSSVATPALSLLNCRLRNAQGHALAARHADISATGCEFAEAGEGPVYLQGGTHVFNHCTFANYYLFSYVSGPLVGFSHIDADSADDSNLPYTQCQIFNSILYGSGGELGRDDLEGTNIYLSRCLLRSSGSDDSHFISTLWGEDPLWFTNRDLYIFDYRLRPESPAASAALSFSLPASALPLPLTDFYGTVHPTPAAVGAMEVNNTNIHI